MGIFIRRYEADVVIYRSPEGKPAHYIQYESGSKHADLKRTAKFCIDEIIEGRPVATGESDLGKVLITQGYKFKPDFEGIALLQIEVREGQKKPLIGFATNVIIRKKSIFD